MLTGNTIHGFTVLHTRPVRELGGTLYELRHGRTGLEAVWLSRPEENRTFGIAFQTLPEDDTGVFHILEHSVLCGSERYPLREPFVELMKTSMNTFLNAMTFPDKTYYPISSRNAHDFINLTRVYLDAVFNPLIYSRPEIFRQEGWHYELEDGVLTRKGVVYNEMRGACADADELETHALMQSLYPDTPYKYESGGAPEHIPELSYEAFIEAHRRCYTPSNAYVFLDGDVDIDEILRILDEEYLARFERSERFAPPALQSPVHPPIKRVEYELPPEEDEKSRYRLVLGRVAGEITDVERMTAVELLCTVLCGDNQAPLTRSILEAGYAEQVSMILWDGCAQPFVRLECRNMKDEAVAPLMELIRSELNKYASQGLDRERLEAAMANLEFQLREHDFGWCPEGLGFSFGVLDSWMRGGDPASRLEVGRLFDILRARMAEGWFEELVRDVLLDNPHAAEVVMVPSHSAGERRRAEDAERLAQIYAQWSDEQREAAQRGMDALNAWQNAPDSPEALASLPKLTLADVSEEPEIYPTEMCGISDVPLLRHEIPSAGIVYASLYFDVTGLEPAEISALSFLCQLLGKVNTSRRSADELSRAIQLNCGSMSFAAAVYERAGGYSLKLRADVSALESKAADAFKLLGEVLNETWLGNERDSLDILRQAKNSAMQNLINNGHNVSVGRVAAMFTPGAAAAEYAHGYSYYYWLREREANWDFAALSAELRAVYEKCVNRAALTASLTGTHSERVDAALAELIDNLPTHNIISGNGVETFPVRREGIEIPSDVGYAALGGLSGEFGGAWQLANRAVSLGYLWNAIRVQGGAYGTGIVTRATGFDCCYSYRDPGAANSLAVYLDSPGFLEALAGSGEDLTGLIIGAVSAFEPLLGVRARGLAADENYFRGFTPETLRAERRELLSAGAEALGAVAAKLRAAFENNGVCVLAPRAELERCGLDEILSL